MTRSNEPSETPRGEQCLQCGQPLDGNFCSNCGQSAEVGPLSVRAIASDVVDSILELELPIIRTTFELLFRPGDVAARWIDGERKRYTNPLKFCVLVGVVVALVSRMLPNNNVNTIDDTINSRFVEAAYIAVSEYLAFVVIVLTIPLAAIAGLLSRTFQIKRSGLDWYALCLYSFGIAVVLQMICGWLGQFASQISGLIPIVYVFLAAWTFCGSEARWRSLLLMFVSVIAWLVVTTIVGQSIAILVAN